MNYLFRTFEDVFHCLIIKDLCCSLDQQLVYFIKLICICQELFSTFFKVERRRRDLNPRAAINDLLPFQGSPFGQLGYFSKSGEGGIRTHAPFRTNGFQDRLVMTTSIPLRICFARISAKKILPSTFVSVNNYFNFFSFFSFQMFEVPCFKYISAISISSGVVIFIFL